MDRPFGRSTAGAGAELEPRRLHRRLVGLCQAASAGSSKAA